jgi:hypothetical protein
MLMDELIAFLRARADDDAAKIAAMEREQTRVRTGPIFQGQTLDWLTGVDLFVSPDRWRAEVETKRRIIDECERTLRYEDYGFNLAEETLQLLALPHADHPDYDEWWRP